MLLPNRLKTTDDHFTKKGNYWTVADTDPDLVVLPVVRSLLTHPQLAAFDNHAERQLVLFDIFKAFDQIQYQDLMKQTGFEFLLHRNFSSSVISRVGRIPCKSFPANAGVSQVSVIAPIDVFFLLTYPIITTKFVPFPRIPPLIRRYPTPCHASSNTDHDRVAILNPFPGVAHNSIESHFKILPFLYLLQASFILLTSSSDSVNLSFTGCFSSWSV